MKFILPLVLVLGLTGCGGFLSGATYNEAEYQKLTTVETRTHIVHDQCTVSDPDNQMDALKVAIYDAIKYLRHRSDNNTKDSMKSVYNIYVQLSNNYENDVLCSELSEQMLVALDTMRGAVATKPGRLF